MAGITRVGLVTILSLTVLAGCNRSTSTTDSTTADGGGAPAASADWSTNPIAIAATDFLDAVLKGDTQRGSARLTPKAMERIVATGKQFDPPGLENPSFRIIEVRAPSDDHAFVQCELRYTAKGAARSEEMCCELRLVNSDWRVSGIAYGTGPDKPWTLSDFETGQDVAIPRQTPTSNANMAGPANMPGSNSGAIRPSPQTAQAVPTDAPAIERR
jgi:hypothetical protein